ncbi:MAG TPA: alkaline phosphatase family protein [Acidimicrobiales bacterium]|nr:alkaline phosphatase family protein [Acidimicrobiales bacterium]
MSGVLTLPGSAHAAGLGGLALPLPLVAPASHPAAAPAALEGVPRYDHVFTIVLENENYDSTWNTPAAGGGPTYLQSLRSQGAFADQYFGVSHVSAGNYIAMTSGQLPNPVFDTDCIISWGICETTEKLTLDGGRSIADQVEGSGQTWKAYMDGMAVPCQHPALTDLQDPYQNGYATRHDPFVYYPPIVENAARCSSHVVNYSQLDTDLLSAATTPSYAFITPDTCHDGHDAPCVAPDTGPGGLDSANAWLSTEVPKILNSPAFTTQRGLLLITFDENGISDIPGCCGALADVNQLVAGGPPTVSGVAALGGRIGLLAIGSTGSGIQAGKVVHSPYDHWSYLRTVEDTLGISEYLNVAGLPITSPMADLLT